MDNEAHSTKDNPQTTKICLTIAGLDPSGGAGIIADIKTFAAFDCFATAAITSLTFQNTTGVFGAIHQTAESIRGQVAPVAEDFRIAAVKTGMLPTRAAIEEIVRLTKEFALPNLVVDPVVRSTSGFDLIDDAALQALIENLFPLARVVTPNVPEAERIARIEIRTEADISRAARIMRDYGARAVLIKGGHQPITNYDEAQQTKDKGQKTTDNKRIAKDYLFDGDQVFIFESEFVETTATHGTGCTLAAGIAANLAHGESLNRAVRAAKDFVTTAIKTAPGIGRGHSPINHDPKSAVLTRKFS